jgi:O-antigen ligase
LKATSAADVGLLLAGSMCLLPFLIPYHQQPVLSFYPEWLAVALGVAAAATVLASRGFAPPAALPTPALWIAGFSVFLVLRAAFGEQAYPQSAVLAALYAVYAALMIQLGAQLVAAHGVARLATVLAGFVLAAALANAAAGVVQFYGRPVLFEDVIAELHGWRAYGNIAQSNLYTNYLALGQAALVLLWLRERLRAPYAVAALALLVVASALSGARAALLYALWLAAFGAWTGHRLGGLDGKRLRRAAYVVAAAIAVAQVVVPWVNGALQLGLAGESAFDRIQALPEERFEPRLPVFLLALRIFAAAPIVGTGVGEFAGAAFDLGLSPALTAIGEVWTSPHDLPLQLLAETGLIGAILALGAMCVWAFRLMRRYRRDANPALWWIVAAVGVELIHSMIEYPLWSAHFLGLTALLIGASAAPTVRSPRLMRTARIAGVAACAVLCVGLAVTLRDYVRLDITRATGSFVTLAPADQVRRDTRTMHALRGGLLGPVAELWIYMGTPLDQRNLADKLAMSERVVRRWPGNTVVVRRAIFLALDGRTMEARALLSKALQLFPHRHEATMRILRQAFDRNPAIIAPLIAIASDSVKDNR